MHCSISLITLCVVVLVDVPGVELLQVFNGDGTHSPSKISIDSSYYTAYANLHLLSLFYTHLLKKGL